MRTALTLSLTLSLTATLLACATQTQPSPVPSAAVPSAVRSAAAAPSAVRSAAAAPSAVAPASKASAAQAATPEPDKQSAADQAQLHMAVQLLRTGQTNTAITLLDQLIRQYESSHKRPHTQYYTARSPAESMFYLLQTAAQKQGRSAYVVSTAWSDAYYLKAYALIEQKQFAAARIQLQKALALAPKNAQYLNELGHIDQVEKHWQKSLDTYQQALAAAQEFSPEEQKIPERCRAYRGLGYSHVELKQWELALQAYSACLAINPHDSRSRAEIDAIRQQNPAR